MSVGVTGVSIAPELGLHFHQGSLSFMERLCCCCGGDKDEPVLNDQLYIDHKMRVMRWQDKRESNGVAVTHARLKLVVLKKLHRMSHNPFDDAEKAFELARVQWSEPQVIYRADLERVNTAVAQIKDSILSLEHE